MKEFISNWFLQKGTILDEELMKSNYLDKGILDSIGFLELISACEEKFELQFDDKDFENEELFTPLGLMHILENKLYSYE